MSKVQLQTEIVQLAKNILPKKKNKIRGMYMAAGIMWLDFIIIYVGLNNSNSFLMSVGMAIMLFAAALVYYYM